jgi:hypothetical protein
MNPKVLELFKEKFKFPPSILKIKMDKATKEAIDKFVSKAHLIFVNKEVEYGKIVEKDKLVEYDSNGIFIYINEFKNIFILTTVARLNVAEFTLHNLIKLNK